MQGGIMQFEHMHSFRLIAAVVFLILTSTLVGFGQHQGHQMPQPKATPTPAPKSKQPTTSPTPSPTNTPHTHMPGMQMPTASPSPEQKMNMPMPMASPSPDAMGQMDGMHGMGSMNMGPLMVMMGNDMG